MRCEKKWKGKGNYVLLCSIINLIDSINFIFIDCLLYFFLKIGEDIN